MGVRTVRRFVGRRPLAIVGGLSAAFLLAACGGGDDTAGGGGGGDADCADYEEYGTFDGAEISVYSPIRDTEAELYEESWAPFLECIDAEVNYEGTGEFEAQLNVRVDGGNAPDIAIFPQPGLLQRFADSGDLVPAPAEVEANVDEGWSPEWKEYGTVDGTFYGAPNSANGKSFVWYSPSAFADAGYEIPETQEELLALTEQIVSDTGNEGPARPWCAGIESGDATGWVATDWMEDYMLRVNGPDVYDQWVNHEIPFDDPQVVAAAEAAAEILKNEDYMNGGLGDVQSITTTAFQDGGLPILEGNCWMHRQASFYSAQWPDGTDVSEEGDVFAFYLPAESADGDQPILGGGEFVAAFVDRPEVAAFQTYLSSVEHANNRAVLGTFISARGDLDASLLENPVDALVYETLQDPNAVFRFDGSDLMPAEVGSASFWRAMTDWINGADTETVLADVEASWPAG